MHLTELTGAAGLFLVAVHGGGGFGDGFLVGNLGFLDIDTNLEFGLGAADGNLDVLVSHTLQDGLVRGGFVMPGKGHILFAQAGEGSGDLCGISLGFGEERDLE